MLVVIYVHMVTSTIPVKIPFFARNIHTQQEQSFSGLKDRKYEIQYDTLKTMAAFEYLMYPQEQYFRSRFFFDRQLDPPGRVMMVCKVRQIRSESNKRRYIKR